MGDKKKNENWLDKVNWPPEVYSKGDEWSHSIRIHSIPFHLIPFIRIPFQSIREASAPFGILSDKALALKTSGFESFYSGQFTFS